MEVMNGLARYSAMSTLRLSFPRRSAETCKGSQFESVEMKGAWLYITRAV